MKFLNELLLYCAGALLLVGCSADYDPALRELIASGAKVEVVADGFVFAESGCDGMTLDENATNRSANGGSLPPPQA
ncbi:MAG: hypothetical protein CMI18_13010 [Opitutaceae bacterium]|nr:hypothetical protein [Opitutaceae bacterium]|tara:strand:+ start:3076 stop:3306 length:231 start_codon:yes stop_codon:yes gene_type:complete